MPDVKLPLPYPDIPWLQESDLRSHPCYTCPKEYLQRYGIERRGRPHREVVLFLLSTALITIVAYQLRVELQTIGLQLSEVVVALSALGALLLGYQQWQEIRHETSMEKYYERLEIANKRREDGGKAVHSMMYSHEDGSEDLQRKMMLVYAELDNLEYMIEKYKLGFMKSEQACRGLRTFQQRCQSAEFRQLASFRVSHGDYGVDTADVVHIVIAQFEAEIEKKKEKTPPPEVSMIGDALLVAVNR